jgi:hypothetical protein
MSTSVPGTVPLRSSVTAKRTTPVSEPYSAVPTNCSATGRAAVQPCGIVVVGATVVPAAGAGAGVTSGAGAGVGLGASWAALGAAVAAPMASAMGATHPMSPSTRRMGSA